MAEKKKKENEYYKDSEALFIPAGALLGMGLGFYYGNIPAGLFIGLGVGFVIFASLAVLKNLRNK